MNNRTDTNRRGAGSIPRNRTRGELPVENASTMPERLDLLTKLAQDNLAAQAEIKDMVGDLRVEMALMQKTHESQGSRIAELSADVRQMMGRQQAAEIQLQQLHQHGAQISRIEQRQDSHELRLRAVEGDGREARVITGAAASTARDIMRYGIGVVGGLVVAAVAYVIKIGGVSP